MRGQDFRAVLGRWRQKSEERLSLTYRPSLSVNITADPLSTVSYLVLLTPDFKSQETVGKQEEAKAGSRSG